MEITDFGEYGHIRRVAAGQGAQHSESRYFTEEGLTEVPVECMDATPVGSKQDSQVKRLTSAAAARRRICEAAMDLTITTMCALRSSGALGGLLACSYTRCPDVNHATGVDLVYSVPTQGPASFGNGPSKTAPTQHKSTD